MGGSQSLPLPHCNGMTDLLNVVPGKGTFSPADNLVFSNVTHANLIGPELCICVDACVRSQTCAWVQYDNGTCATVSSLAVQDSTDGGDGNGGGNGWDWWGSKPAAGPQVSMWFKEASSPIYGQDVYLAQAIQVQDPSERNLVDVVPFQAPDAYQDRWRFPYGPITFCHDVCQVLPTCQVAVYSTQDELCHLKAFEKFRNALENFGIAYKKDPNDGRGPQFR